VCTAIQPVLDAILADKLRGLYDRCVKLVIANKNYSSWSLRAWLVLRHAEIPFDEVLLRFTAPDFAAQVRRYSPACRVPVLVDGATTIWDSLAICEYLAESFPDRRLWPADRVARAHARSVCAEMHAGFAALRSRLPMNCELSLPGARFETAVRRDVDRIVAIWRDCRSYTDDGPLLFGRFTIADAYFAPVVFRFASYAVPLPDDAQRYADAVRALPAMQGWLADARAEHDFVPEDEPYRDSRESPAVVR
jgi:glutathione S-transferase